MRARPVSVSVVIPVLNGSGLIGEALASVACQTCMPFEIIVVDGGSTDDSASVVQRFAAQPDAPHTRFLVHADPGAASKRNAGAALATGVYLAFLDADDVWPNDRTESLLRLMQDDPGLDCVTGKIQQFREALQFDTLCRILGAPAATRLPSAALIKRSSFEKVGTFDLGLSRGETIEWWSRAMDIGFRTAAIDSIVLLRRVHEGNLGRAQAEQGREYLKMLHLVLERRNGKPLRK